MHIGIIYYQYFEIIYIYIYDLILNALLIEILIF